MQGKDLQVFGFNEREIRVVMRGDEPWFVVNDVCEVLELTNSRVVVERLPEDDVSQTDVIDSMGRKQATNIVNDAGLYELVFRSDKPEAARFRYWVTHEVLPAIRKTGKFAVSKIQVPPMVEKLEEMLRETKKEARRDAIPWEMAMKLQTSLLEQINKWGDVERSNSIVRCITDEGKEIGIISKIV